MLILSKYQLISLWKDVGVIVIILFLTNEYKKIVRWLNTGLVLLIPQE